METSNRERILSFFLESPTKQFQMREICRLSKISFPSVRAYLLSLEKEGIIRKGSGNVFSYFIANRENKEFKILKVNHWRIQIEESGILNELGLLYPDCIILFGSCARGEDTEKSDLDLFVQAKQSAISLEKFEKTLKRKINLLFEPDLKKLQKELKNNLANGIVLDGYLKFF